MAATMAVMGLFDSLAQADQVAGDLLRNAGFVRNDISIVAPGNGGANGESSEHETKSVDAAVKGGAGAGGTFGGTLGLLAGLGVLAIPGMGPLAAIGPILGAFTGAATGAALGGLAGGLIGLGVPERDAALYEEQLRAGNVLLSVHVETVAEQARARLVLARNGAHDVVAIDA